LQPRLDVSHHEQLLFELVCKSAARLAKNYITATLTRAKIADPDFKIQVDKDVLACRVTRDYCNEHIRDDRLKTLKINSSVDLMVAFDKVRQSVSVHECQNTFDEPAEGSQDEEDEDLLFAKAETGRSTDLQGSKLDLLGSINKELTVLNKNEEQSKINEATADEMANDQALTKSTILDLFKTEMGKFKKEMRANSWAGPKT
jgi:hypothetical protein